MRDKLTAAIHEADMCDCDDGLEYPVFCRKCAGKRNHKRHAWIEKPWAEELVYGCDRYGIFECRGCNTVSFMHEHYFSEDYEAGEDGIVPVVHRDTYPPSNPNKKKPDWAEEFLLYLSPNKSWIYFTYLEIYEALAIKTYALAAMGARSIIDDIITSSVGDSGSFEDKLKFAVRSNLVSELQSHSVMAAFDNASATAHRGFRPKEKDSFFLIEVAEGLIEAAFVKPGLERRHAEEAKRIKALTPPRPPRPSKKGSTPKA